MPKVSKKNTQTTLFQAWNKTVHNHVKCNSSASKSGYIEIKQPCADIVDVDDDDLLNAAVAFENSFDDNTNSPPTNNEIEDIPGFDNFSGKLWIYPTNYPIREYQHLIVKSALFKNTLVALPTGLGKTFIAAVVMYNFYRWYPQGKIVFMAPTKPLVAQQIEACYNIMGIPMKDQAQITGSTMASGQRAALWTSKRVFFLTPQVINNDLTRGVCPASQIKCIVIDEAHKALGNHAYCQVIQQLLACSRDFRVLALSATPGSDLKTVQQVIKNLLISHIELRSEDAIDIQQYTHSRSVEKVVVKLSDQILKMKVKYLSVIQVFINNLISNKVVYNKDAAYFSKYALLMARDQFRKDPPSGLSRSTMGSIEGTFATLISLYHGLELLVQHGLKSFFIFLKGMMDGDKANSRVKATLYSNETFREIYNELIDLFGSSPECVVLHTQPSGTQYSSKQPKQHEAEDKSYVYSHPKMQKLEEVILNHFQNAISDAGSSKRNETRVMVFCQYRDSVREITELLQMHRPLVRPMQFVGHASSTNSTASGKSGGKQNRRFTQKDQLLVINKFRSGDYNTLVSTCVGEEGLDIGDVDLIVCFDSHKSPIRLVQRMGRTGRKRKGKIVMLITEGKEERDYNSSLASRRSIHKAITGSGKTLQYYPHNPRMVPVGLSPECHKMFMTVVADPKVDEKIPRKPKKKGNVVDSADISEMFRESKASIFLDKHQRESWKRNLQLTEDERKQQKTLPRGGICLYLQKHLWARNPSTSSLSLSEWLPWQCRLQKTKYIGHSTTSKMFAELLEFCDDLKQSDESVFDQKFGSSCRLDDVSTKKNSHAPNTTQFLKDCTNIAEKKRNQAKLVLKKKQKGSFIVISDDDDDDDFMEDKAELPVPTFGVEKIPDSKMVKAISNSLEINAACEVSMLATSQDQHVTCAKEQGVSHTTIVSDCTDGKASQQEHVIGDNQKGKKTACNFTGMGDSKVERLSNKYFERDSFNSISALCSTLTQPDDVCHDFDKSALGKSKYQHDKAYRETSSAAESFTFAFLGSDEEKSNETIKRTCFKLWDSDEENGHFVKSNYARNKEYSLKDITTEEHDKNKRKCANYDANIILDNEMHESMKTTVSVLDPKLKKERNTKTKRDEAAFKVTTMLDENLGRKSNKKPYESEDNLTAKVSYETKLPCNHPPSSTHLVDSFDMSADMFSPQFDLDFDFKFETQTLSNNDPVIPNIAHVTEDVVVSTTSGTGFLEFSALTTTSNICNNNSSLLNLTTTTTQPRVSSTTLASVNSSQAKRMENKALFADLSVMVNDYKVPFASVKPQRIYSQTTSVNTSNNDLVLSSGSAKYMNIIPKSEDKGLSLCMKRKRIQSTESEDDLKDFICAKQRYLGQSKNKGQSTDDESDVSLILPPKRRGKIAINISDTSCSDHESFHCDGSDFKQEISTCLQSDHSDHENFIKSNLETPIFSNIKHSTPKSIFKSDNTNTELNQNEEPISMHKQKRPVKVKPKQLYIQDEAEVSARGLNLSSDEDVDEIVTDEEMLAFVNDATQLSQNIEANGSVPNEKAMYLHSMKNQFDKKHCITENLGGRYKLAYGVGLDMDVFSQMPEQDISDYVEDSFCVGTTEFEEQSEPDEVSILKSLKVGKDSSPAPRTRAQAKWSEYAKNEIKCAENEKKKSKPSSGRRRIVMYDDESCQTDTESDFECVDGTGDLNNQEQPENVTPVRWKTSDQIISNSKCASNSSERLCELCNSILTAKGWLCRKCIEGKRILKNEKQQNSTSVKYQSSELTKGKNLLAKDGFASSIKQNLCNTSHMTREERLNRSRKKQLELKEKHGRRKSNVYQDFSSPVFPKSTAFSEAGKNIGSSLNKKLCSDETLSPLEKSYKTQCCSISPQSTIKASLPKINDNLVIIVDNREINSGATELVQTLRNQSGINVIIANLQGSSYAMGTRTVAIRRTVDDITITSKKSRLLEQMRRSSLYSDRFYLIIEKSRVKQGWMKSRSSASRLTQFLSNITAMSQGHIRTLFSDNQKQTAHLLISLAEKDYRSGRYIDRKVVTQSASKDQQLISLYMTIPGVSFVHSCYLVHYFKSLKRIVNSSLDDLVSKTLLPEKVALNLMKFLRKKFDIQMTPM